MKTQPTQIDAYKLLHEGTLAFSRAEQQGIRIDLDYCENSKKTLTEKIKNLESEFYDTKFYRHWSHATNGKPNINSSAQLGWFLYKIKKLKPTKSTVTGKGSTDEEALESLGLPEVKLLLQIRKLKKLRDTYLKGFLSEQVDGQLHPHFNLNTATTFRSSSSAINFQNIPIRDAEAQRICRQAIYPRHGHQLMEVDYSQIEVCVSACYHMDSTMISYIENPASDMHGDMSEQIFLLSKLGRTFPGYKTLRGAAKNGFVFPQFYGDYYKNCALSMAGSWGGLPETGKWKEEKGLKITEDTYLSDHLISYGLKSMNDFIHHIQDIEKDFWGRRFSGYARWKDQWWRTYQKNGYIDMLTGFRCYGPMSRNDCTNYPIQGSAFHCLLWAFIRLDKILRKRKFKTRLVGQIHDAMVLDVWPPEVEQIVALLYEVMIVELKQTWDWIIVPLAIEIDLGGVDKNWYELEPYKMAG